MERGFRGVRRALYHPPGRSASVEAPGEQRNPQELSSCPYRGKQGPRMSQGPTALTQAGTKSCWHTCCIFHPVWPALEAWCHNSQPMSGALGYPQVPGQGGGQAGKCHHLWCTGCGRAAPSSSARSSRQHSMVHTDWFHWFRSKVTEESPWLPRTPAGWGRGHGPSQVLLLSLPTLSPSGPGLPLPGPCQLLSLCCASACPFM